MNLRQRIAWRRRRYERIEKDLRALAGQAEVLLQRWNDLHDRVVVLEDPVKRAAQDLGLSATGPRTEGPGSEGNRT